MKLFEVDADGVIYHVAANNEKEACLQVKKQDLQDMGELSNKYEATERKTDIPICYGEEDIPDTTAYTLISGMSKPGILGCSEW